SDSGDFVFGDPPSPTVPDLYLQYDYLGPSAAETTDHAPPPAAVDAVVAAFANRGIVLHIDPVHQALPHASVVYFPAVSGPDSCATGDAVRFDALKGAHFDQKRKYAYHYLVFGHDSCYGGASEGAASGIAEIHGNDGIVSLGSFTYTGSSATELRKRETAGT